MNTIDQHMQLSKQQRQSHIDLSTECYGFIVPRGPNKGQWSKQGGYAKQRLLNFHQIERFKSFKIHTCHLCPNDSTTPNGYVCINPLHLYFGSVTENHFDKPENLRKKGGKVSGKLPASEKTKQVAAKIGAKTQKKLFKEGRHVSQQLHTCPVCGLQGKGGTMKRWHFDNCKHKILP